jgi:hypothetical protein|tara:strand:- start:417 stop:710 length:294 start_codon:yes stop_codon:yes gene_type:complete
MIDGTYKFVTDADQKWQCVGLTEKAGLYQGVVYRYGKVSIPRTEELTEEGDLPFRFEYDIVDSNGLEQEHFGQDFFKLIGDILVDIITNEEQIDTNN